MEIGTFLSGGLDSSIINGIVSDNLPYRYYSYTLGNPGTEFDESDRARKIARSLNTQHQVININSERILSSINQFSEAFQEPFGDYSAIPTLMISEEARKNNKILLSGDGSDEFFFGYNRNVDCVPGNTFILWFAFSGNTTMGWKVHTSQTLGLEPFQEPAIMEDHEYNNKPRLLSLGVFLTR